MLKLLISLAGGFTLAIAMLQLRAQGLNLNLENCRLHNQIESQQSRLWSQQMRIAEATAPTAIMQRVKDANIRFEPLNHMNRRPWMTPRADQSTASTAD